MRRKISELGLEEIQEVENLNIKSRDRIILQKSESILRGDKMKRTLIDDLFRVSRSLSCEPNKDNIFYYHCEHCKNKKLCDTVEDVIKSIGDLYNEN